MSIRSAAACAVSVASACACVSQSQASSQFIFNPGVDFEVVTFDDRILGSIEQDAFFGGVGSLSLSYSGEGISGLGELETAASFYATSLSAVGGSVGTDGWLQILHSDGGVEVTNATDVLIEWDLTAAPNPNILSSSSVSIYDESTATNLFLAGAGTFGSQIVTLQPGTSYTLTHLFEADLTGFRDSATAFASFTIVPAPGVGALFGVLAVGTACRRKR